MTIDDVGHFSEEEKARIIASYPPHEREARTKGVPILGSGRIDIDGICVAVPCELDRSEWMLPAEVAAPQYEANGLGSRDARRRFSREAFGK